MEARKITLKDIAQASGYSLVTVHRAMNNKEGVSKAVRQEILSVADRLGYTTNYVASALKRRQVNLAVVLPEPEGDGKYYFQYVWKGCHVARDNVAGYNLNVMEYTFPVIGYSGSREQLEILKKLYEEWGSQLDGLLTMPSIGSTQMQCLLSQFAGRSISVVLIDNDFRDCGRLCCISPNDVYTGRLAAELMDLVLKGRQGTILVAQGDEHSPSHKMNTEGFASYFEEHNADIRMRYLQDLSNPEKIQMQMLQYLREDPDIIGAYSTRARDTIPLCKALTGSGRENEVFAVGSDLFPESAQMLSDGILKAIIYKNPYQKGYLGFNILFEELIKGAAPKAEAVSVPISIILQNNIQFFKEFI
ncbi:MAG: substrate-binding domain-containing protein [Clostridiales bacterium]|nr:substrate-binding domain-containing protein [Clostridiales bacterium]